MPDLVCTYQVKKKVTLNTFTKPGYTFKGWYEYRASDNTWFTNNSWQTEEAIKAYGYKKAVRADGYNTYYPTKADNDVLTLYAVWTANTYTIRYDANGGEGSMPDQTFIYAKAQNVYLNTFTKPGYTFSGWHQYRTSDNTWYTGAGWKTDEEIKAGGYKKVLRKDGYSSYHPTKINNDVLILSAVWKANTYTVRFDANGGNGIMPDQVFTYAKAKTVSLNQFTKPGSTFIGWHEYRSSDNTWLTKESSWQTEEAIAANGFTKKLRADGYSSYYPTKVNNDVLILYAVWQQTK